MPMMQGGRWVHAGPPGPSVPGGPMSKRTLFAALAVVGLSAAGLVLHAQEPKADPVARNNEFAGKIVFVQARGGVRAATLEGATIRQLSHRPFLVGKAINDEALTQRQFFTG